MLWEEKLERSLTAQTRARCSGANDVSVTPETDREANRNAQMDELDALAAIFGDDALGEDVEDAKRRMEECDFDGREAVGKSDRLFRFTLALKCETGDDGGFSVKTREETSSATLSAKLVATPELFLEVIFPADYPAIGPPAYAIRANWLSNSHLSALCARLDDMCSDEALRGQPVVYEWASFLQERALADVLLTDDGVLDLSDVALGWCGEDFELDPRGVTTCQSALDAEFALLRADALSRRQAFLASADNLCKLCFCDDVKGVNMRQISATCRHQFCVDCVERMVEVHVRDGSVTQLVCPEPRCSCAMDPSVVKAVLDDEQFEKYESMLLAKTLDSMPDLVYCPRCETPVLEDEGDDHCGRCTNCMYAFCTLCRDAWHAGAECLNAAQRLAVLEGRRAGNSQMSEEALRKYREELADATAAAYVAKRGKRCPECKAGVEKNEGCNKMTCACGAYFCWTCGQKLSGDGYSHYRNVNGEDGSSACQLFDLAAVEAWEDQMARLNLAGAANDAARRGAGAADARTADIARCVRCKAANARFDRNNHIRCWACDTHFCRACHKVVIGKSTDHYGPGKPCKQHG
jgi:E3 ubiquitin-protein ligase RNF14